MDTDSSLCLLQWRLCAFLGGMTLSKLLNSLTFILSINKTGISRLISQDHLQNLDKFLSMWWTINITSPSQYTSLKSHKFKYLVMHNIPKAIVSSKHLLWQWSVSINTEYLFLVTQKSPKTESLNLIMLKF